MRPSISHSAPLGKELGTTEQDRRLGYIASLDGLRAVAIALVVAYHATGAPAGGWMGVDLFFVLSGFLITTLLIERQGAEPLTRFYERRAVRLFPALGVLLVVSLAIDRSPAGALVGASYVTNFLMATGHADVVPQSLHHLWSLGAEEQFYLVWPVALLVSVRVSRKIGLVVAIGGALVSVVFTLVLFLDSAGGSRLFYAPDTRAAPLLIGCALALLIMEHRVRARRLEVPAIALFAALVVTMDSTNLSVSGPPILLLALAAAVLILRALDASSLLARSLRFTPIVLLGRISYSLYLWHYPIFIWLGVDETRPDRRDLVAVALAIGVALVSYYGVERPMLGLYRRRRARASTAPAVVMPPAIPIPALK